MTGCVVLRCMERRKNVLTIVKLIYSPLKINLVDPCFLYNDSVVTVFVSVSRASDLLRSLKMRRNFVFGCVLVFSFYFLGKIRCHN